MAKAKKTENTEITENTVILIGAANQDAFAPLLGDALTPGSIALGCLAGDEVAGAAVFSITGHLGVIDSILVREKFRRRGIGRLLFTEAVTSFKSTGITHILINYSDEPGMTEFLKSVGFTVVTAGHLCTVDLKKLAEAGQVRNVLRDAAGSKRRIRPYRSLSDQQKKGLRELVRENGFSPKVLDKGALHTGLSFVMLHDTRPVGMILAVRDGNDFIVTLLLNTDHSRTTLPILLSYFLAEALKRSREGSKVRFFEKQKAMEKFLKFLMKGVTDPYTLTPCSEGIWSEDFKG